MLHVNSVIMPANEMSDNRRHVTSRCSQQQRRQNSVTRRQLCSFLAHRCPDHKPARETLYPLKHDYNLCVFYEINFLIQVYQRDFSFLGILSFCYSYRYKNIHRFEISLKKGFGCFLKSTQFIGKV